MKHLILLHFLLACRDLYEARIEVEMGDNPEHAKNLYLEARGAYNAIKPIFLSVADAKFKNYLMEIVEFPVLGTRIIIHDRQRLNTIIKMLLNEE